MQKTDITTRKKNTQIVEITTKKSKHDLCTGPGKESFFGKI